MRKTNFDLFLEEQLRNPDFAERFKRAGEAWDVALQIAALREKAGLSQRIDSSLRTQFRVRLLSISDLSKFETRFCGSCKRQTIWPLLFARRRGAPGSHPSGRAIDA